MSATQNSRYRGVSYRRPIDAAKAAVPVIDLADLLCGPGQMRRRGAEWVARCPLPDHEDRFPSFSVNARKNVWHCFGCLRGGDVVELYRVTHDYSEREAHVAAANLLTEFGHEIPQRPPAWFRRQERQREMRGLVDDARVEILTRRLWRYVVEPIVLEIEDEEERGVVAARLWPALEFRARQLLQERDERGRGAA